MMTDATRATFPLGEVLSVTTGILVSDIVSVYRVLDFMEGFAHMTHELPDASTRMAPVILRQVPELAEAHPPKLTNEAECLAWVERVADYIGRAEIELKSVGAREGVT